MEEAIDNDCGENIDSSDGNAVIPEKELARRECYYLYYEVKSNGAILQQIFCRGTTLLDDVGTCLQSWMIYDDDCECYIHKGFRDHANRILNDVIPLLVPPPPNNSNTTLNDSSKPTSSSHRRRVYVEVCGHSLGGAVASILSIKLRKLGHNVTQLTTVGEPRYILFPWRISSTERQQQIQKVISLLPKKQIRIENDLDFVPYLPSYGTKVGNKIWLLSDSAPRYIPTTTSADNTSWTDSALLNFRVPEMIASHGVPHRIPRYVQGLKSVLNDNDSFQRNQTTAQ